MKHASYSPSLQPSLSFFFLHISRRANVFRICTLDTAAPDGSRLPVSRQQTFWDAVYTMSQQIVPSQNAILVFKTRASLFSFAIYSFWARECSNGFPQKKRSIFQGCHPTMITWQSMAAKSYYKTVPDLTVWMRDRYSRTVYVRTVELYNKVQLHANMYCMCLTGFFDKLFLSIFSYTCISENALKACSCQKLYKPGLKYGRSQACDRRWVASFLVFMDCVGWCTKYDFSLCSWSVLRKKPLWPSRNSDTWRKCCARL